MLSGASANYDRGLFRASLTGAVAGTLLLVGIHLLPIEGLDHDPWAVPLWQLLPLQLLGLFAGYRAASSSDSIWRRFVPHSLMKEAVERAARNAFSTLGIDKTRDSTGILIYVSLFERIVVVLGDRAIDSRLPAGTWNEVKELVLDTIVGIPDGTTIAFKVNALEHPNPTDFAIGGNCLGADGATTAYCVATVTFTPKSPGPKTDPISAQISITKGMAEVEASLQAALNDQGIKGTLVNLIYPLIRSNVQTLLTDGVESALLAPVGTATGTGVAGPYTDPAVFGN